MTLFDTADVYGGGRSESIIGTSSKQTKSPAMAEANAAVSSLPPLSPELHTQLSHFYEEQVAEYIRGPC